MLISDGRSRGAKPFDLGAARTPNEIEVEATLARLRLGDLLEEQRRTRAVDRDGGIGFGRSSHRGESRDLFVVVGTHRVVVQCCGPEAGE